MAVIHFNDKGMQCSEQVSAKLARHVAEEHNRNVALKNQNDLLARELAQLYHLVIDVGHEKPTYRTFYAMLDRAEKLKIEWQTRRSEDDG